MKTSFRRTLWSSLLLSLVLAIASLLPVSAFAQNPVLVQDINAVLDGFEPRDFTTIGSLMFFTADDGVNGRELWRTDGSEAGTFMVEDLFEGEESSNPGLIGEINGVLIFHAETDDNGRELFTSNGDQGNAELVKDITGNSSDGYRDNSPSFFGSDDKLYFTGATFGPAGTGVELYRTDGTEAGTELAADIRVGSISSSPLLLGPLADLILLRANDGNGAGDELWKFDIDTDTASLVADIRPLGGSSLILFDAAELNGELFFRADDGTFGSEVWKTDGTEAGTERVSDINPGSEGAFPSDFVAAGERMFFKARSDSTGIELFATEGDLASTGLVQDLNPLPSGSGSPSEMTEFNGFLVFAADGGLTGTELYVTDGEGVFLYDLFPGGGSSSPASFQQFGDMLYFSAIDATFGRELFALDGQSFTVSRVTDQGPGAKNFSPGPLGVLNGELIMAGVVEQRGLFRSNGTDAGTSLIAQLSNSDRTENGFPEGIAAVSDDSALFTAQRSEEGEWLWISNGGAAGTIPLVGGIERDSFSRPGAPIGESGDLFVFPATRSDIGEEVWRTDGTADGTFPLKDINPGPRSGVSIFQAFVPVGDQVFFTANNNPIEFNNEVWVTDGSPEGTRLVKEIRDGGTSSPLSLVALNDILLFEAQQVQFDSALWRSDGTEAGTFLVKNIVPGSADNITSPVVLGNEVLFRSFSPGIGDELLKTDGTADGTVVVRDINPTGGSSPGRLTRVGDRVFFRADDGTRGTELWSSDGTEGGTDIVKDINDGPGDSNPDDLVALGDLLFFIASDGILGKRIWRSDGTEDGTVVLSDSILGNDVEEIVAVGNLLYFSVTVPDVGRVLYRSDGTDDGTEQIDPPESEPIPAGFIARELTPVGSDLFFERNDPELGFELFTIVDDCPELTDVFDAGPCGCGVAVVDTDGDSTPDCIDTCLNDSFKTEPLTCGCGVEETDRDGDGSPDCVDICPDDIGKLDFGICGCGVEDIDTDQDGVFDCNDTCPTDASKSEPGICGCGNLELDIDTNGQIDCGVLQEDEIRDLSVLSLGAPDITVIGRRVIIELTAIEGATAYICEVQERFKNKKGKRKRRTTLLTSSTSELERRVKRPSTVRVTCVAENEISQTQESLTVRKKVRKRKKKK